MKPRVWLGVWLGFGGLCLLSGSGWVLDEWRPGVLPGLAGLAVRSAVLAGLFWAASGWFGGNFGRGFGRGVGGSWPRLAGWAGLLAGLPPVAIAGAEGAISRLTMVLVFASVPAFVVFVAARRAEGFGAGESPLGWLGPALLGLAGAALVLPSNLPGSLQGELWLGVIVVVAGVSGWAAVRVHELLAGVPVLAGAAVFAGVAAGVAGAFCWVDWGPVAWSGSGLLVEAARCLGLEGPVLLLTVWLLREMGPVGFSSRMLLIPLVTILEGYAMLRPETNWTMVAGILMLAGGGFLLLRAEPGEMRREV